MSNKCAQCGSILPSSPKPQVPAKHEHTFGEGYYSSVGGVRVSQTLVCKGGCGYSEVRPVNAETKAPTLKVYGLSSGERLNK